MRNVDFSPLYRNAIGFDRLLNLMEANTAKNTSGGYPPYNIEQKDEHNYRITMAVAGFRPCGRSRLPHASASRAIRPIGISDEWSK